MKNQRNRTRTVVVVSVGAAFLVAVSGCSVKTGAAGGGDSYPAGSLEFVVSAPPGGGTDLVGRALAVGLEDDLAQTVPVINLPGAGGAIAAGDVLNGTPDGYRVVILPGSLLTISPLFVGDDEAVTVDDMSVIAGIGREDYVLLANADSEFKTLEDIANADKTLNYATSGVGTGSQLTQRLIFGEMGIDTVDVPFEGGAPAVTALLGNQVDLLSTHLIESMPQIEAGTLVPIAVFGEERNEFLPDVPTAAEEGYDVVLTQTRFIAAPPGLPEEVKTRLEQAFTASFERDGYRELIRGNYITPEETDPQTTEDALTDARQRIADAVEESGIDLSGS